MPPMLLGGLQRLGAASYSLSRRAPILPTPCRS